MHSDHWSQRCPRRLHHRCIMAGVLFVLANWVSGAHGATLQELVNGGSLIAGGSRFSDWQLVESDATSGVLPNLSLITVNPLAGDTLNPGLQYSSGNQLSVTGINAIDFILKFRVSALTGSSPYNGQSLSMTGVSFGSGGGIAYVSNEVRSYLGVDLGPAVVIADNESGANQSNASSSFVAQPGVVVATSVFITGISSGDSVNLSGFTQRFGQSGSPVLAGDYNLDGAVNAADYVVWRKSNGPADGYDAWRTEFGRSGSGASPSVGSHESAEVPEPGLGVLPALAIGVLAIRRKQIPRKG